MPRSVSLCLAVQEAAAAGPASPPNALPGLWREAWTIGDLVRLDVPAVTPGMVVVARVSEDWKRQPELRWQVWPEDLEPVTPTDEPAPLQ